jgi:hypothetical protein
VEASGLVTGQIDDDGDGPVDPDPRRPPNMFVHPEGRTSLSRAGLLVRALASTSIASQQVARVHVG